MQHTIYFPALVASFCRFIQFDWILKADYSVKYSHLVWATGLGNPPAVRVQTAKTVWFDSKPVQKPNPLHLGRPNPDPYPSTCGFCRVWLDPSVPISGSSIRVFLFMVAFRYHIANRKILTLVYHCPFLMYWPPL